MTGGEIRGAVGNGQRTLLALAFAATVVIVCVARRHFTLSLAHPQSFRLMLVHRCGQLLAAAVAWLALELSLEMKRACGPGRRTV